MSDTPVKLIWKFPVCVAMALTASVSCEAEETVGTASSWQPSEAIQKLLEAAPPEFTRQFVPRVPAPYYVPKRPGHYTATDWQAVIDSTWGDGLPTTTKYSIYSSFWQWIDTAFTCFQDLAVNWDAIWRADSAEILDTVSRGRFCGILTHASLALREAHTKASETGVTNTALAPGVPLLYLGGWGENGHFGAGLTPLPDSSLLVYKVAPAHPYGLAPGDIVLGYDGRPWKELYPELLAAGLPLSGWWWGCSETAYTHSMLMSAGMNWHLFDTIDVIQYTSGDTLHFATAALDGQSMSVFATEQLDIPGVSLPDWTTGQIASWGIVDGTQIGYIYCMGWYGDVEEQWRNAIDSLMHQETTTGLIVDFRTNYGGNMFLAHDGLALLFRDDVRSIRWFSRCDPDDHLAMCQSAPDDQATIFSDSSTFYDKPIAVLVGPGAISSGDQIALRMAFHPMAKFFGKPTTAAFNGPRTVNLYSGFNFRYAHSDPELISHPGRYITHDEYPSAQDFPWVNYEDVWLTPDNVAQGTDDVVEAAMTWIMAADRDQDGLINENDNCPDSANPAQADADADGIGDVCDNCPADSSLDQTDTDLDGVGDFCDNCPLDTNAAQTDGDGDGIGDACDDCAVVMTGDLSGDHSITSTDVIFEVNYIFKGGPVPTPCEAAGDVNCDGSVTSADIIYLVNYVFKGGPAPCDVCNLVPDTWLCP